ncbi:hypothetical protein GS399_10295 [Pedobacter sp. HMF7647]|uniref:Uncharacterized protein n=1 Tax=Hufsiella arboris TaxID=2695275 RepID=A0A7K1YB86_9SPHI|nr:hypothetical protein [Hufsiella arboris]MXV51359.1 hypothetical protein [Hufsiella arboris]
MSEPTTYIGKRILAIGTKASVLVQFVGKLQKEGFVTSHSANLKTVLTDFNGKDFDLIVIGRGIKKQQKDLLSDAFKKQNAGVKIVNGLAPITNMLLEQVKQTFIDDAYRKELVLNFDNNHLEITCDFRTEHTLIIKEYSLNWLYQARETILFQASLVKGKFTSPVKPGNEKFISVIIDNQPITIRKL